MFGDCAPHMSDEGLHLNRTRGIQWKMSFKQWSASPGLRSYTGFFNPNPETSKPVIQVNEVSYGKATWHHKSDHPNNGQPDPAWFNNTCRENNRHPRGPFRKIPGQQAYKHGPKKVVCYYLLCIAENRLECKRTVITVMPSKVK